jgi:hypothetical protein
MSDKATTTRPPHRVTVPAPRSLWAPHRRWYVVPLAVFALTRVVDAVLLVLLGRSQFLADALPVAPRRPPLETGRSYWDLVANWDGQWYRYVAEHGYPGRLPSVDGVVQANQWAFYPLYPSLVRVVTWTGLPFGIAASVVSLGFGAAAMCLLYRMLAPGLSGFGASMSVLALCVAPAGVIWQAAYAESLALFLVLVCLWALRSHRYGAFLAAAFALSLTRPIVLPLAALAAVHWYARFRRRATEPFPRREQVGCALAALLTGASMLIWPVTAAVVTGQRDAFFVTRSAWTASGTHGWTTWLAALAGGVSPVLVVLIPVVVLALLVALLRPPAARWGRDLRWWGLLYPLYLLGSTRLTTSIFRYALLSVIPWWPFPEVEQRVTRPRDQVSLFVLVLVLGVMTQVFWMRWFFVVGPAAISYP